MASPPFRVERVCLDPCLAAAATDTTTPAADDDDNNFSFLPEDAIFEILSWLAAKSLYRSRCVSKKWRALTSSPAFIAAHSSRAEPLLVAMTSASAGRKADRQLQLMDTEGNVVRVEKTGGWFHSFCLSYDGLAYLIHPHEYSYNQLIDLSQSAAEKLMTCDTPKIHFTGKWIDSCIGVGRAIKSGTPKIFGVVHESTITGLYQCLLLTARSEGAEWRPIRPPPYSIYAVYDNYNEGVTFNGYVHFLSLDEDNVLVVCFDLETEAWKVIQGPSEVSSHVAGEKISIAELNRALCLVQKISAMICLWLLTDPSTGTWVRSYTIHIGYKPIHRLMPLRMLHPSGKLLFCYFYDDSYMASELQIYDPCSGRCTKVMNAPTNFIGTIRLCSSHIDPRF